MYPDVGPVQRAAETQKRCVSTVQDADSQSGIEPTLQLSPPNPRMNSHFCWTARSFCHHNHRIEVAAVAANAGVADRDKPRGPQLHGRHGERGQAVNWYCFRGGHLGVCRLQSEVGDEYRAKLRGDLSGAEKGCVGRA